MKVSEALREVIEKSKLTNSSNDEKDNLEKVKEEDT